MDARPEFELDMGQYGGKAGDIVVMGVPSARAEIRLRNQVGALLGPDGRPNGAKAGDVEIYMILSFVKKAPFNHTVEAFLDYCDTLSDEGSALLLEMGEIVAKLKDPSVSPTQA